jgi:hypothetical protein
LVLISGTSQFKKDLPIFTRSGWEIPLPDQSEKPPIQDPRLVSIRANALLEKGPNRKIRSISGYPYSCVGMLFASRRAFVEIDHIYEILHHDGYRQLLRNDVMRGDIVLYKNGAKPSHVGLIIQAELLQHSTHLDILVLSKWGKDAEFIHRIEDVPDIYGQASEYWTERPEVS